MIKSMASPADLQLATMGAGIAMVLVAGTALGSLARRLRQPAVIGEIVAGVVLGPTVLGQFPGNLTGRLFPADVRPLLGAVSQIGLLLFMFMVGWEFERKLLRPHGRAAAGVSLSSVGLAFGGGVGVAVLLYPRHSEVAGHHVAFPAFVTFIGAAMSVTAFPVLARILADSRLTGTRVGSLAIASAAVDDLAAWCLLAYVSALVTARGSSGVVQVLVLSGAYVVVMALAVRPVVRALVARWARAGRRQPVVALICAGVLLSSWLTTWIGIHAIFGAFAFGFVMPRDDGEPWVERVRGPLDNIGLVLMPVFFIVTGLGVDLGALHGRDWLELAAVLAVACGGKLVGALVPARACGLTWWESWTLGLLMNTRGLTELIILHAAVTLGVLDGRMFTMMVLMALATTAMAAPLLPRDHAVLQTPTVVARPRPLAAAVAGAADADG